MSYFIPWHVPFWQHIALVCRTCGGDVKPMPYFPRFYTCENCKSMMHEYNVRQIVRDNCIS